MGFFTKFSINYDPHHVISNRGGALKRKTFEHDEVARLEEAANWSDYPHETKKDTDMREGSNSSVKEITSLHLGTFNLVSVAEKIMPLGSYSEKTNKRDFLDVMDTEEEDTVKTPKKPIIEVEGQLVQSRKEDRGKKNTKVAGPSFEVKEYAFFDTPIDSTSQFKDKTQLMEK